MNYIYCHSIIIIITIELHSCSPFLQVIDEILKSGERPPRKTKKVSFKIQDELDQLDDTLTEAIKLNMRIKHNDSQLYKPQSILVRSTAPTAESVSQRDCKLLFFFSYIYNDTTYLCSGNKLCHCAPLKCELTSKMVADQLHKPHLILVRSTALGAESLSPRASKLFVFIYL